MGEITKLTQDIIAFRDARDWEQFHTPSHLAAALAIEAAEVQELFLWRSDAEVEDWIEGGGDSELARELADIAIFALLLAHETDVDLERAVQKKLEENERKYPVDLAKGRAAKYTELDREPKEDSEPLDEPSGADET